MEIVYQNKYYPQHKGIRSEFYLKLCILHPIKLQRLTRQFYSSVDTPNITEQANKYLTLNIFQN